MREGVGRPGVAAQRVHRVLIGAGGPPQPEVDRGRGYMASSVPNCSAIVSGEWLGSMMPPAPSRMVEVCAPMCAISTLVADDAMRRHVVVLGVPDPGVAELLGPLRERARWRRTLSVAV